MGGLRPRFQRRPGKHEAARGVSPIPSHSRDFADPLGTSLLADGDYGSDGTVTRLVGWTSPDCLRRPAY